MGHNLFGAEGEIQVLLVGEDEQRHALEELLLKKLSQVVFDFLDASFISWIDDVDERVSLLVIVAPIGPDLSLTADVPHIQLKSILRLQQSYDENDAIWVRIEALGREKIIEFLNRLLTSDLILNPYVG